MSEYLTKPKSILTLSMIALLLLGAFLIVPKNSAVAQEPVAIDAVTAETYLRRVGLGPESFAASGIDAAGATNVINDLVAHLQSNLQSIDSAEAELDAARAQHDALLRAVRQGDSTGEAYPALQTARTTLATAESALETLLDSVFTDATADLTTLQRNELTTIHGNNAHRGPVAFKVSDRSEASWLNIRSALAAERIAIDEGEAVPDGAATLLTNVRAESAVAASQAAYDVRYSSVVTAIDAVLGAL